MFFAQKYGSLDAVLGKCAPADLWLTTVSVKILCKKYGIH